MIIPTRCQPLKHFPLYYPFGSTRVRNVLKYFKDQSSGSGEKTNSKTTQVFCLTCFQCGLSLTMLTVINLSRFSFLDLGTWGKLFRQQQLSMSTISTSISMIIVHQLWLATSWSWKFCQLKVLIPIRKKISAFCGMFGIILNGQRSLENDFSLF